MLVVYLTHQSHSNSLYQPHSIFPSIIFYPQLSFNRWNSQIMHVKHTKYVLYIVIKKLFYPILKPQNDLKLPCMYLNTHFKSLGGKKKFTLPLNFSGQICPNGTNFVQIVNICVHWMENNYNKIIIKWIQATKIILKLDKYIININICKCI